MNKQYDVRLVTNEDLRPQMNRQIVFHGINKTGSLVFSDAIRGAYAVSERSNEFFSLYHKEPQDENAFYRALLSGRPGFFVGHYLYKRYPTVKEGGPVYYTQVRDPVRRIVSAYGWLRMKHVRRGMPLHQFPSLQEFVLQSEGKAHSQIEHFGLGWGAIDSVLRSSERKAASPEQLYVQSIRRLTRDTLFVGITELFEESLFLLAHTCGLNSIPMWNPDARNRMRLDASEVLDSDIEAIRETFYFDIALYEWARNRMEKLIMETSFGGEFSQYKEDSLMHFR